MLLLGVVVMLGAAFVASAAGPLGKARTDGSKVQQRALASEKEVRTPEAATIQVSPAGELRRATTTTDARQSAALVPLSAQRKIASTTDLVGQVGTSKNLTFNNYYHLPKADGEDFVDMGNAYYNLNFGHYYDPETNTVTGVASQILFGEPTFIYLLTYDMSTLELVEKRDIDDINMMALGADRDPATGLIYGIFYNESLRSYVFGYADYAAATRTAVKALGSASDICQAMAFDSEGQLYGIKVYDGTLVKFDKATGDMTTVGATAVPCDYNIGGTYDPRSNSLLVNAVAKDQQSSSLYQVDLATGATSVLATYSMAQIYNMFILRSKAADEAPAAPVLSVSAPQGTMTVQCSITLPDVCFDGSALTGNLDWELYVNGVKKDSGTAEAGATVKSDVAVDKAGETTFKAVCYNAAGASPEATETVVVGKGCPAAPADAKASWTDGIMTLTWSPVTASSDGGYIDADMVTYDVFYGDVCLAQNLTATTYSFELAKPEVHVDFRYSIVAKYDGKTSAPAYTNNVGLGDYAAPFHTVFNSSTIFTDYGYTVLDVNKDNDTWTAQPSGARYKYNTQNKANDWLITPEIRFEAGKSYKLEFIVASENATNTERVEIAIGKGATPEALTTILIPELEVTAVLRTGPMTLSAIFSPEETGAYNIGVHAVSERDRYYLWLTDLSVDAGMLPESPVAPAKLTLTPDATGLLKVHGEVVLPTKSVTDGDLTADVTARVECDGRAVSTLTGAPGATVSFDDVVPERGTYSYTATAYVGDAQGLSITESVFVGPYMPLKPAKATVAETDDAGVVTVTWTPVSEDVNGNTVAASQVTYQVYSIDEKGNLTPVLAEPTASTAATFTAVAEGQDFVQFAVRSFNREIASEEAAYTEMIAVGKAYEMPVELSSITDLDKYIVGIDNTGKAEWRMAYASDLSVPNCDADGVVFFCYSDYYYRYADIFTGKVNITAADRPELSFYIWKHADDDETQYVVSVMTEGEETELMDFECSGLETAHWNKVRFDLSDFIGQEVQVKIRAVCQSYSYMIIDNIQIKEVPDYDVAALFTDAPVNVKAGQRFDVRVSVENFGYETARNIDVKLMRNGDLLDATTIASLIPYGQKYVTFTDVIDHFDAINDHADYHAVATVAGDKDPRNDATDVTVVTRPLSSLCAVDDLKAELTDGGVHLTWTPYTVGDLVPVEITEDFESGESWANSSFGDWTFVDRDESPIWPPFSCAQIPNYSQGAFWLFDNTAQGYQTSDFKSVSGSKYLMGFYCYDGEVNDDWAISPLLPGTAQTISFWARGFYVLGSESFEVLYSTVDNCQPEEFKLLKRVDGVENTWTKYTYELPEGALHFAIRYISYDQYAFLIDDVTFTPDPALHALTLKGYDVYRNGVKLTDMPVNDCHYYDSEVTEYAPHTYHVMAHYEQGSSELSNPAVLGNSGLTDITASCATVAVDGTYIVVAGTEGVAVTIATADGRLMYSGNGDARVAASAGVYIVSVGNYTTKVLVR